MNKKVIRNILLSFIMVTAVLINLAYLPGKLNNNLINIPKLFSLIIFICFYMINEKVDYHNKKLFILSFIMSICGVIGYYLTKYETISYAYASILQIGKVVVYLIGYTFIVYNILYFAGNFIEKIKYKESSNKYIKYIFDDHPILAPFIILLVVYLMWLCIFYPGVLMEDGSDEIRQFLGHDTWSVHYINLIDESVYINGHHSPFHTVIIGYIYTLFNNIGHPRLGIFFNALLQVLAQSFILAYSFNLMKKLKTNYILRIFILACYLLLPYFCINVFGVYKDIPFSMFVALYTILLIEYLYLKEDSKKKLVYLLLVSLIIMMLSNKGLYIVVLTTIAMFIKFFKNNKKLCLALLIPIVVFLAYDKVFLRMVKVTPGSVQEALSIPIQQVSRYIVYYPDDLDEDDIRNISAVLPYESISKLYEADFVDPIKNKFNKDYTSDDVKNFLITWGKLFIRHPNIYVSAFANQTFGYLYFERNNGLAYFESSLNIRYRSEFADAIEVAHPNLTKKISKLYLIAAKFPVVNLLLNVAFYDWVLILLVVYVFGKDKEKIIPYIPALVVLLFCFLSPVNGNRRYIYPIIYSMPVLVCYGLSVKKKDEVMEVKSNKNLKLNKKVDVDDKLFKNKKIAVLIPCYNESLTIAKVVKDYKKVLPEADIYVYDNNSSDHTDDIARKAGAIVKYEYRQGKGNVVRSMFRDIDADCYLMIDGDDTYPAESAREMCSYILSGRADMVIGDRLSSTYFEENKRPFHNFGNKLVRFSINKIFKNDIKDIMTGYRAFSYEFVKGFPVLSKGFEIETEMSIHAVDKNFKLVEIPIEYRDRPNGSVSKLNTYKDGFKVLKMIVTLFKEYRPNLFFNLFSLLCIIISLVLGIPVLNEYFETGLVPRFPSLIVSTIFLVIAMLLWVTGTILGVIVKKHKQLYELYLNKLK